jgi:hypothetical protein
LAWKVFQNHIAPKNSWISGQFGGYSGYSGLGAYTPGQVYTNEAGEPFILGADNQWVPMDDGQELAYGQDDDWTMLGQNALEVPGPLGFADVLEPVGRLGASPITESAYARHLINR